MKKKERFLLISADRKANCSVNESRVFPYRETVTHTNDNMKRGF